VVIFGAVVTASLDEYRNIGKQTALQKEKKQNSVKKKRKSLTSEQK